MYKKINCSIIIHTKNEEDYLQECLDTLIWSDDIIIFDSYSTDKTKEIAIANSCKYKLRPNYNKNKPFGGNESEHRNWGMKNINFKYKWVFIIDADERCTYLCYQSIKKAIENKKKNLVAFRIKRRDFFQNKHLYHTQLTPWYIRLVKPKFITYSRLINCSSYVNGITSNISGYIDHFPFKKGISAWIERHNFYSTYEAQEFRKFKTSKINIKLLKTVFFEKDFELRRSAQKILFYKLPLRPYIKFFFTYIVKRGFLDGKAGFDYAMLQFFYEFLISLKQKE